MPRRRQRPPAEEPAELVHLNARIPRGLLRRVKVRCTEEDRLLRDFITEAPREELARVRAR